MSTLKSRKVMLNLGSGNSVGSLQQRSEKMPQARSILFFLIKLQQWPPLLCFPKKNATSELPPSPIALVGDSWGTTRHRLPPHPRPPLVAGGGPMAEPKSAPPAPPRLSSLSPNSFLLPPYNHVVPHRRRPPGPDPASSLSDPGPPWLDLSSVRVRRRWRLLC